MKPRQPTTGPRVLFVLSSLGVGGTEVSTAVLLPMLQERGLEVSAVTTRRSQFGPYEEAVRTAGIPVHVFEATGMLGRMNELRRLIKAAQPDVVHTAIYDTDIIGRVASWQTGTVVVSSIVSTPYVAERLRDPAIKRWKLQLTRWLDMATTHLSVKRLHAVSPGSADAASTALRFRRDRIDVIRRGRAIRPSLGDSSRKRTDVRMSLGVPHDAFLVLAVGRHDHLKAHPDLIASFDLLLQRVPSAWLVIAGREGGATTQLRDALAHHVAAARRTLILGHRDDVRDLMAAADVLAISSVLEGTAGAALEAMAEGLPVAATASAGVRGILVHEVNCLLAPIGPAEALATQLERIASDPRLRIQLIETGRRQAIDEFSLDVVADSMATWYRNLVNNSLHGESSVQSATIVS